MKTDAPSYHGYRFPPEIISHAVWLYHRFCVSFRNVEELLAQRGITVSYEAVRLWCIKFGPEYARRLKRRQGRLGDTWLCLPFIHPRAPNLISLRSAGTIVIRKKEDRPEAADHGGSKTRNQRWIDFLRSTGNN